MKKLVQFIILSLLIFSSVSAETRNNELNNLFKLLKNSENTKAIEIENKIWKIWITHPSEDRRGYRLTELLVQGIQRQHGCLALLGYVLLAGPSKFPDSFYK